MEINVPKGRQIKLKSKPGYEPKTTDEGDRRIYRWTYTHLQDEDQERPGKKKKKNPHKSEDEVPTVQLTTFQSWEELGTWYASSGTRPAPARAMPSRRRPKSWCKGKTDDMAKVKALYEYVSRNIRYVSLSFGLGRIQPHEASEVLSNGYGDCKDKNTLLAALLAAEGFQVDFRADRFATRARSRHSFALAVRSRDYARAGRWQRYLARQHQRGRSVPHAGRSLRNKQALAISSRRQSQPGVDAGRIAISQLSIARPINGSINETGTLKAHITIRCARRPGVVPAFRHAPDAEKSLERFLHHGLQRTGHEGR